MSITIGMFATALIPNLNRRPQFILGALSLALHMFLLGFDNYLGWSSSIPSLNYFPIVLLISFGFNYGIGIGTVSFILLEKFFHNNSEHMDVLFLWHFDISIHLSN